ncbi:MAG: oligosaccharide flippase family protein, partial [Lachnospiraceae bacterium]|nr:oligosaccharide flippase family protein [Lachnospiraceae bacterium]
MKNKKNDSFILQAGILAASGIIVRIIGILYRSPLTSIIGDEGNGYYGAAYNIYTIILLLASYSIPSAISKVIAQKLALKEYRNAHRIFRCAFIYVFVVGGLASVLTFCFAGVLVDENAVPVLRVFTPTIFLSGILGVYRGYFQAHRTMVQTSLSQILEQILNAIISILAAWLLMRAAAAAGADSAT